MIDVIIGSMSELHCEEATLPPQVITEEHLTALDLAIASGELRIRLDNREIMYQSTSQMLKARKHIAGVLMAQAIQENACLRRRRYAVVVR